MDEKLEEKISIYKETGMRLQPESDYADYSMKRTHKRTRVTKRIMISNLVSAMLITVMIPVTAYAATQISKALYEKTRNAGLTQDEIVGLDTDLKEHGFSEEDISGFDELQVNETGQTYGPDALGADLIEVMYQEGKIGYVYRTDLYGNQPKTISEVLNEPKMRDLTVYDKDGKTVIGIFVLTNGQEVS